MGDFRKGSHTVYDIQYHFIWITKYRYKILRDRLRKDSGNYSVRDAKPEE